MPAVRPGTALSGAPMAAGTYTVVASFAGTPDYAPASAMTTFTVNLAAPTVTVTDAGGTFNGQPSRPRPQSRAWSSVWITPRRPPWREPA